MSWRRLGRGLLVVLIGAAAVGLQTSRWDYSEAYGPLFVSGRIGQTIQGSRLRVRVRPVVLARSVEARDEYGERAVLHPNDVFVVVPATVVATREPTHLWTAELQTSQGRFDRSDQLWGGDDRFPEAIDVPTLAQHYTLHQLQPDRPRHGVFLFDVPVQALPGSTLVLSHRDPWTPGVGRFREDPERFGAEMRIDLDLDHARVDALMRSAERRLAVGRPRG
jgi:hypothetical protein